MVGAPPKPQLRTLGWSHLQLRPRARGKRTDLVAVGEQLRADGVRQPWEARDLRQRLKAAASRSSTFHSRTFCSFSLLSEGRLFGKGYFFPCVFLPPWSLKTEKPVIFVVSSPWGYVKV